MENNKINSEDSKFEFFDVTADVGFKAYGNSLEKAFENAAIATFEVITDTSKVKPEILENIQLEAEDDCAILYDWLSELLFLHDSKFMVFSKFQVTLDSKIEKLQEKFFLTAKAYGEEFDPSRHERRSEVKAVTYHMMDIKFENRYVVQVILDI